MGANRRRRVSGLAVLGGGLLLCCLFPYVGVDLTVNLVNRAPRPVVPEYPNGREAQRRVERHGVSTERVTTFRTTDSPEAIKDFYARNLGPSGARWSRTPHTEPFRTWEYNPGYCPATYVRLTYTQDRSGIVGAYIWTTVELRVEQTACRDLLFEVLGR